MSASKRRAAAARRGERRTTTGMPKCDPDLDARRREAARTVFGCEHPDRHHYRNQAEADDGLRRALVRHPDLPAASRVVVDCCSVGWIWLSE